MAAGIGHEEAERRGRERGRLPAGSRAKVIDYHSLNREGADTYDGAEGMSIREIFAMHALAGMIQSLPAGDTISAAHDAVEAADALLTELERTDPR